MLMNSASSIRFAWLHTGCMGKSAALVLIVQSDIPRWLRVEVTTRISRAVLMLLGWHIRPDVTISRGICHKTRPHCTLIQMASEISDLNLVNQSNAHTDATAFLQPETPPVVKLCCCAEKFKSQ